MLDYYIEKDLAERYAQKRKGLEAKEVEEFISIIFSYLKERMKAQESYAINTPIGYFYKEYINIDEFLKTDFNKYTKEYKFKEKMFYNQLSKLKPKQTFKYKDVEDIKERTNNS